MSRRLRIRSLTVATRKTAHTFHLAEPYSLVTGTVSMGKSTMLMLIKHGLGGRAALTPAVKKHVTHVDLAIQVGDAALTVRRKVIDDNGTVDLLELGSDLAYQNLLLTARNSDDATLSRLLLKELDVPAERIPRSARGLNAKTVSLTFYDIFAYCYVQAKEIDRSVVGHLDFHRNQKRVAAFDLMFGLIDSRLLELKRRRNEAKEQARKAEKDVAAVERFIVESGQPDPEALRLSRLQVLGELRKANKLLEEIRHQVEALTEQDRAARRALSDAISKAREKRARLGEAQEVVAWRESALGQLKIDLAKTVRLGSAAITLAPFEFLSCPRCMQTLSQRSTPSGHCLLCLQSEPEVDLDDSSVTSEELARLNDQIAESEHLLSMERLHLSSLSEEADEAERSVGLLHREYDEATASSVSPRMDAVAARSVAVEMLRQRLRDIDRGMAQWGRLESLRLQVRQFKKDERALSVDIKDHEKGLQRNRAQVQELSREFAREVEYLGIPIEGEAHIDQGTYLPMVGTTSFEDLQASGGGASTALNIAYHLTILQHSIDDPNVMLPDLLIIDSPRKAIGNSEADRELGRRIYSRLQLLADSNPNKVQIIVADNDPPVDLTAAVPSIRLTEGRSTVPGVPNTGVGEGGRVEDFEAD